MPSGRIVLCVQVGLHSPCFLLYQRETSYFFSWLFGLCHKEDYQRIDTFKLWCWRRLLRIPWTARSSNQSILKEFNPEYSLVGLVLKLKLQYFGHLMRRADSLEKSLLLGKIEGRRRRELQNMRWLDNITDSQWTWVWANSGILWRSEKLGVLQSVGLQRIGHNWMTEQLKSICIVLSSLILHAGSTFLSDKVMQSPLCDGLLGIKIFIYCSWCTACRYLILNQGLNLHP